MVYGQYTTAVHRHDAMQSAWIQPLAVVHCYIAKGVKVQNKNKKYHLMVSINVYWLYTTPPRAVLLKYSVLELNFYGAVSVHLFYQYKKTMMEFKYNFCWHHLAKWVLSGLNGDFLGKDGYFLGNHGDFPLVKAQLPNRYMGH